MNKEETCVNCGKTILLNKYYCSESCFTHANMGDSNLDYSFLANEKLWKRIMNKTEHRPVTITLPIDYWDSLTTTEIRDENMRKILKKAFDKAVDNSVDDENVWNRLNKKLDLKLFKEKFAKMKKRNK